MKRFQVMTLAVALLVMSCSLIPASARFLDGDVSTTSQEKFKGLPKPTLPDIPKPDLPSLGAGCSPPPESPYLESPPYASPSPVYESPPYSPSPVYESPPYSPSPVWKSPPAGGY